ncbi:hypothetical protein GCM10010343_33100 [Streptomyces avidinii]|nr:hypothetical protein GCM10010343_33100 [Streptomyces avidinii]
MVTAMVKEANRPIAGSTPAMIEKEIASGISASETTSPASTSVRSTFGDSQDGRKPRRRTGMDTAESGKGSRPVSAKDGTRERGNGGTRERENDPQRYRAGRGTRPGARCAGGPAG